MHTECVCVFSCLVVSDTLHLIELTFAYGAHQAPLSMGFSRQEYWRGLPRPPPWDLPDPGIQTRVSCITGGFLNC